MRRIFFVALVSLACGAVGTRAETDTTNSQTPTPLKDSIIVTADRFGETASKSIWPAAAIKLDQVQNESSFKQALDGRYGLDIRETSGFGSLATLSNWGTFNRHMLLLYNGRPVKDYSLGGFNLADYSLDEFDRIEVVKGPQSAFYGSDAVGGVVNLISPSALIDRLSVTTRTGTLGLRQYCVDASRAFGKIGAGAFAEYGQTDNGRVNSGSKRELFGVRSEYLSGDSRHHLTASLRYFKDSVGLPGPMPDPSTIPVYGNSESYSLNQRQQDEDYSGDFSYRYYDSTVGEAQLDAFWEKKNLDYNLLYNYQNPYYTYDTVGGVPDSAFNSDSVDVYSRSIYNKRSSGISGRFLKEIGFGRLSSGIDWLSGSLRATGSDRTLGTNLVGPSAPYQYTYRSYSYWANAQNQLDLWGAASIQPYPILDFDLSGRLQYVRDRKTQPSYDLGLMVTPVSHVRAKLGYGFAFRLPSIADQFADDFYTSGNINLEPETSRSLMLSLDGELPSGRLRGSLTYFNQTVHSLIQYVTDPVTFRTVPHNVDRFRSHGVDFWLVAAPIESLTVSVGGVWQKAEQTNGDPADYVKAFYVPNLKWHADLTSPGFLGRFRANAGVTYTSDRYLLLYGGSSAKTIASVYELNAGLSARLSRNVSLALSGQDLTDQKRPDQFGYSLTDHDFPSPGRRFTVQLKFAAM